MRANIDTTPLARECTQYDVGSVPGLVDAADPRASMYRDQNSDKRLIR